ncbi:MULTISPECIES: molybdate ABC transporter permease subunit [Sphingomonadaceae]|uniref:molybdate ABC transporter permease subunit n=1 Tax=Sphingomonadaceae TaxID=41297 RepID=UPI0011584713|nr:MULTISPECIES: molybdate ABC transporter permease subunit [Sphingomonadaceae]QDK32951.1 molybdate ABC transporter permease subunit [Sphingomonas sp. IC081]QSR18285.1 molybdate ABC transporter permease [Novosphingobium sp. KA1]
MSALTPEEWEVLLLSLKVSGAAMACVLPVAFALAWALARWRFPGLILLDALVHLPLVLPPVVTGWLLLIALAPNAPLGRFFADALGMTFLFRWTGAALAAGVMALPLMVRAMRLSLEAVDRKLEQAARTLGAGPVRTFVSVTLPLAMPGVLAALVLGFARSIGEFGATITFASNIPGETRTLPLAIYNALQIPGSEWQVTRLAGLSVLLSLIALVLSEWLARRGRAEGMHHVL